MIRRLLATTVLGAVVLAGCDGSTDQPEADPSAPSTGTDETSSTVTGTPTDPGPVVECPDDIVEADPALPDAVPEGATSVRLCGAAPGKFTPPVDAYTLDVAAVTEAVNKQRLVVRPCADRQLPTYQLAFGYPDGSRFVVAGRFTSCAELLVGSGRRARAGPPLHKFIDLLLAQRATATPPEQTTVPADLKCGQPTADAVFPLGEPTGLTVAVLCVGQPEQPDRARRVTIPGADLATLVQSMRRHTTWASDIFACSVFPPRTDHWIVGADAWGDPITMRRLCRGLHYGPDREWRPDRESRAIVARLVAEAR